MQQLQERILAGGTEGTGKTYAWLTIARALPEHKFYVIDPDDGVRRVWFKEFPELHNIEYYFTPTWYTVDYEVFDNRGPQAKKMDDGVYNTYRAGTADAWEIIKPKIKIGDWVVVEHLHLLWNNVQGSFADEVFDKKIGQYFLEKRKLMRGGAKRLDALEGWTDWSVINKMHNDDFINEVCYENLGHVFMTTSTTLAQKESKEDAEIKAFYGDSMIRFEGQKHNAFRVQTKLILKMEVARDTRKYIVNTFLKDRGRDWLKDEEWTDFYYQYLCAIAGWI